MTSLAHEHSYEELREIVIDLLLNARDNGVDRFERILEQAALALSRKDGSDSRQHGVDPGPVRLRQEDGELILEIVWDLFRQGVVTFGLNAANPGWPWLRLSRFGECALQHGLYRFHNKFEFMKALHSEAIDLSPDAVVYLREAVTAFYAGCLLSACVLLGVAAEAEFLRLLETARDSRTHGKHFTRVGDGSNIRARVMRFGEAVKPVLSLLPGQEASDAMEALTTLQSILRVTRTEQGHPSGASPPSRDQVYVYLQLFIPFAEQLTRLRRTLAEADYPRLVAAP
ncbi:hypothetical protein DFR50_106176 [Roseiarcus fermentans]|uniref:Uncharacterized protein n=1 Tax=Roseiarcus fermentans TaxID=1473586 RepID=A0A366FNE5_9HYPH|nr:hypothetical protein [Roseiarcus fermentans]RBP16214.1 hypothetical protein DFR50_106176 [Roseiarcus fermentans]